MYAYKVLPYSDEAVNELAIHQMLAAGCAHILPLVAVFDNLLFTNDTLLVLVGKASEPLPFELPQQKRYLIAVMPALACDTMDLLCSGYYSEEKKSAVHLNVAQINEMVRQMAVALAHIHAMQYIHADFKLENVLVQQVEPRVHVYVCDFGFARRINQPQVKFQHSAPYVAPEMVQAYTTRLSKDVPVCMGPSIDVWALGVCLYVLYVRAHPFAIQRLNYGKPKECTHAPLAVLMQGCPMVPLVQAGVRSAGCAVLYALLTPAPQCRPSAAWAAAHAFLKGV